MNLRNPKCWVLIYPNGHEVVEWDEPVSTAAKIIPLYDEAALLSVRNETIEEAAKVADKNASEYEFDLQSCGIGGNKEGAVWDEGAVEGCKSTAHRIRSLRGEEKEKDGK